MILTASPHVSLAFLRKITIFGSRINHSYWHLHEWSSKYCGHWVFLFAFHDMPGYPYPSSKTSPSSWEFTSILALECKECQLKYTWTHILLSQYGTLINLRQCQSNWQHFLAYFHSTFPTEIIQVLNIFHFPIRTNAIVSYSHLPLSNGKNVNHYGRICTGSCTAYTVPDRMAGYVAIR